MWPKFESKEVGLKLAYTGTIKEEILDKTEVAFALLTFLLKNKENVIIERYKITKEEIDELLNRDEYLENENIYEIFLLIGKRRGCIMSGGHIDEEKISRIMLDEFKNGVIRKNHYWDSKIKIKKKIKNKNEKTKNIEYNN